MVGHSASEGRVECEPIKEWVGLLTGVLVLIVVLGYGYVFAFSAGVV